MTTYSAHHQVIGSGHSLNRGLKFYCQSNLPLGTMGHRLRDSRMSPDLPRGTGKSIVGDLDVDDDGSE
jgi:hypothetical protein